MNSTHIRAISMAIAIAGLSIGLGLCPGKTDRDFTLFLLLLAVLVPWWVEFVVWPHLPWMRRGVAALWRRFMAAPAAPAPPPPAAVPPSVLPEARDA